MNVLRWHSGGDVGTGAGQRWRHLGPCLATWACTATVVLSIPVAAQAFECSELVSFGDSLSDNGGSDGHGFGRYTNGDVWIEYLADSLGCQKVEGRAWGGARTDGSNVNALDWSGLAWQVEHYEAFRQPQRTLVTVWAGGNDLFDGKSDADKAVERVTQAIDRLISKGAINILVGNLPDLTLAPFYRPKPWSEVVGQVRERVDRFNAALSRWVAQKQEQQSAANTKVRLCYADFHRLFSTVIEQREFLEVNKPWKGTYHFPAQKLYLWWDDSHPMTYVHKRVADYAAEALKRAKLLAGS